jgi:hypothetical protein
MLFRKKATPKPIKSWHQDPVAVVRLREIITDPVFQTAAATLSAMVQPSFSVIQKRSVDARAASFDWLAGYHDFVRDLEKLATPSAEEETHTETEWGHIQPNFDL